MAKRLVPAFFIIALFASMLSGCAAAKNEDPIFDGYVERNFDDYNENETGESSAESPAEEIAQTDEDNGTGSGAASLLTETQRKLVKSASAEIETLDYDKSVGDLEKLVSKYGGYYESSDMSGSNATEQGYTSQSRVARYSLRIPSDKFDVFQDDLKSIGNILQSKTNEEDKSFEYYDMESRLTALQVQQERILELLKKATALTDVIELERELSNISYQIENYTSAIRKIDTLVDYSTVTLTLREVYSYHNVTGTPKTLGERISQRFNATVAGLAAFGENFVVWLLGDSIVIVIWLAVIAAAVIIIMKFVKKNAKKKEEQMKLLEEASKKYNEKE